MAAKPKAKALAAHIRGRPATVTEVIRDRLVRQYGEGDETLASRLATELTRLALHSDSEAIRAQAIRELLDRTEGKPRQAVEHTGDNGGPIQTVVRFARDDSESAL